MIKLKSILLLVFLFNIQIIWTQTSVDSSKVIRVLSFNILHGATTKGDFNLDVLAQVINDAKPDFVAMQEVDFKTNRAKQLDLTTELGWRTKMASVFGKAMPFDGGEYGEGVLSRYSFISTKTNALPYLAGTEPRAALEITTTLPSGDTISFIGTHLDHLKEETNRIAQAKKINEIFTLNEHPTLLVGDLNATPGSTPINILESRWNASYKKNNPEPTYPSSSPKIKIDYVMYYPKNRWRVLKTEVIKNTIASDHCAYLVTLELLDK
ncbi:endonuclease/exonuclease/phosphatase family protein [Aestuariibaculum sediminum]|uniref:Endonuclease/exonuclease/phosphatase family protein n=1 Tax=Aestuariibaculum sediminum TaxID=2770637 RepID=A0A8J6Q0Z1_9FLAO|nr:endonuclease/exonuclease/phosphatase family protein [Aestuariibaculum sediminum]MBD0830599.1 endonuclease/exonuclease/phosphatase family protein [Aestuariibaculum sediminum]